MGSKRLFLNAVVIFGKLNKMHSGSLLQSFKVATSILANAGNRFLLMDGAVFINFANKGGW